MAFENWTLLVSERCCLSLRMYKTEWENFVGNQVVRRRLLGSTIKYLEKVLNVNRLR